MKFIQVTPETLDAAWQHARPWLEKANQRGGGGHYPVDDYKKDIAEGKKRLFKLLQGDAFAWLLIGCVENSQQRGCIVYCLGGQGALDIMGEIVSACEEFARFNKCKYITCTGRAGWVRELGKYGWKEISRTCGKEL